MNPNSDSSLSRSAAGFAAALLLGAVLLNATAAHAAGFQACTQQNPCPEPEPKQMVFQPANPKPELCLNLENDCGPKPQVEQGADGLAVCIPPTHGPNPCDGEESDPNDGEGGPNNEPENPQPEPENPQPEPENPQSEPENPQSDPNNEPNPGPEGSGKAHEPSEVGPADVEPEPEPNAALEIAGDVDEPAERFGIGWQGWAAAAAILAVGLAMIFWPNRRKQE